MKTNILPARKALLALFTTLMTALASAHDFEVDGIYYNIISTTTVEVTYQGDDRWNGDSSYEGYIFIPTTVYYDGKEYSVTSIGECAFYRCYNLYDVYIPESVTDIHHSAFEACGLYSIHIPKSVTDIASTAFNHSYISYIVVEEGNTVYDSRDGCNAIIETNSNTLVIGCNNTVIPESVTSIGNWAFCGCDYLYNITIPKSVTTIESFAFYECYDLTTITISENSQLTSIQEYAFEGSSWYNNQPNGVVYIGNILYEYKGTMPENTSIEVREGTVAISSSAFEGCKNLTSITIPKSVTRIGQRAFDDTSWYDNQPDGVVYVGKVLYKYKGTMPENTSIEVREETAGISDWAFEGCKNLTSITLPNSITSIGSYAFSACSSLKNITIPDGITSIKEWTFFGCNFNTINIPESVKYIKTWAFGTCKSLTSIIIPKGVTSIEKDAFINCSSLTNIIVDEDNINYDSRGGCNAIIETSSNTLIVGCSSTIIPESVTSIGESAFRRCSSLTHITLPNSVTSIGSYAFGECTNLTDITIPDGMTNIGDEAFCSCSSLTCITIPKGVTSIGNAAFYGCSNLTSITSKATIPSVIKGSLTFYNVNKSIPVYVPAGSVEAYQKTEYWSLFTNIIGVENFKCVTPTITYEDGRFSLTCDTEGAEVITHAAIKDKVTFHGIEFEFTPTLVFTAYATKAHYEDSDVATLTLCWIPCTEEHESEETGILTIPSKPVLISTQGGTITLSGLAADTEVAAYNTAGTQLATTMATAGTATLTTNLTTGDIAIVKIGEHSIKIVIK